MHARVGTTQGRLVLYSDLWCDDFATRVEAEATAVGWLMLVQTANGGSPADPCCAAHPQESRSRDVSFEDESPQLVWILCASFLKSIPEAQNASGVVPTTYRLWPVSQCCRPAGLIPQVVCVCSVCQGQKDAVTTRGFGIITLS